MYIALNKNNTSHIVSKSVIEMYIKLHKNNISHLVSKSVIEIYIYFGIVFVTWYYFDWLYIFQINRYQYSSKK